MAAALYTLTLAAALVAADPPDKSDSPRKPNPFAPSLPELTKEEEDKIDGVIDRMIRADTGKLRAEDAKAAMSAFNKLGAEAIPGLIRGINRAAQMEHSCPTLLLHKKLARMLMASHDTELLEFAHDNIGAGVGRSLHMRALQDLRVQCTLRKNALLRAGTASSAPVATNVVGWGGTKAPKDMTVAELSEAAGTERGPRLRQILTELEQRKGPEVFQGLALGTADSEPEIRQYSRSLLDRHLGRQKPEVVKEKLKDEEPEVRKAAARAVAARVPSLAGDVVELLADEEADVRQAAREALVKLSKGEDFGPDEKATKEQREEALAKWREWWKRQKR
jgi:hypothetical protein